MSNQKCCVPGCGNNSGSKDTLHKFPHPIKQREMFNTWVYSVGGPILGLENDHIFKYRRVCHIHFEEKYWCQNNRLSNIAVPTKNLPGLSTIKFAGNETYLKGTHYSSSEASTSKENDAVTAVPVSARERSPETTAELEIKENLDKGILAQESKDTADILLFFDRLFDSVNGSFDKKSKRYSKPLLGPATPRSVHYQFWTEAKKKLKAMKFINARSNKVEHVPTLKNWVWTLEGIEDLLKNLKHKYGLRHLNQDPIENFFESIRSHGCRNINPTPEKFESAFTTMLINSLSSVHAPGANCEVDNCVALHEAIITGATERIVNPEINLPNVMITPLEEKNDPREIGGLQYVSGYFIKKAKQNVFKGCDQCKKDLISESELEYIKYREYANKKWLYNPSDSLLCCVSSLQDINYDTIKENLEKNNLKELLKTVILMFLEFDFIKCEIHKDDLIKYLINISCRFCIYNYCKDVNKILGNRRACDDEDDTLKMKAKKYYAKCFKRKVTK